MKRLILLGLLFSCASSMEQPLQVVRLENYTLISNDGQEITLSGDIVKEYLPGLAERFRAGMREAQSGKITIADLDGQALKNLQTLLGEYILFKSTIDQKKRDIAQKETAQNYLAQIDSLDKLLTEQIAAKIEKLPNIGDHFIALFKEMISWQVPLPLEEGMAQFAGNNLDILQAYELLKDIDTRAQLLYLAEVDLSADLIVKALEWFAQLENSPMAIKMENLELFDKVRARIIDFIAQNIMQILAKYPQFKNIWQRPEFNHLGKLLRLELIRKPLAIFTSVIRPGKRWENSPNIPFVHDLGNAIVGLHDNTASNNIYDYKLKSFKNAPFINSLDTISKRYVLWGTDKIIVDDNVEKNLSIYDINTGTKDSRKLKVEILNLLPINPHLCLAISSTISSTFSAYLYYEYDVLKITDITTRYAQKYSITTWLKNIPKARGIIINDQEYITLALAQAADVKLSLRNVNRKAPIREVVIPTSSNYYLSEFRKLNNNELGMVLVADDRAAVNLKYVRVSLPDLKVISVVDRPQYEMNVGNYRFLPLSDHYILINQYIFGREQKIYIYDVLSGRTILLIGFNSAVILDNLHIASFDLVSNNFIVRFVYEIATLSEILDEIQTKIASAQRGQPLPAQPQKRSRSPVREENPIPAAAQGLRPEEPEIKQPRLEKPEKPNG